MRTSHNLPISDLGNVSCANQNLMGQSPKVIRRKKKRKSCTELTGQHDVPSKRLQVVQVDQNSSNVLVEAVEQPHQEP